jgi:peptidoglycan hydrolase-like protein with peptidoglycan-binding domain
LVSTGIQKIDNLWANPAEPPIGPGNPDRDAVTCVQELLLCQGERLNSADGQFGPQTGAAVSAFQGQHGKDPDGQVDHDTLHLLAEQPSPKPFTARGYLALVLDQSWTGFPRLVGLTARFEGAGRFGALNRNTDRAGLSFGIIQWAQKPGRLNEILRALELAQQALFVEIFGNGDASVSTGLLAHTAKPFGGVNKLGQTTDPKYDLVNDSWTARFAKAALDRAWQKTQFTEATAAFRKSCAAIRAFAPVARSERAFAFLIDAANQHGDTGLKNICSVSVKADMDEAAMMAAVEAESVRRVTAQFDQGSPEADSTRTRRDFFRTSPLLSNDPLQAE